MGGAIFAATELLAIAARAGVVFKGGPEIDSDLIEAVNSGDLVVLRLRYQRVKDAGDPQKTKVWQAAILQTLSKVIRDGIATFSPSPAKRSEDKKADPLEIAIVSMPDRTTTTEIERDADGDIKKSTQKETDARAA